MLDQQDFKSIVAKNTDPYLNTAVATPNDHVLKLSIMTSPYPWHSHPNSDETFIGVEGTVIIETTEETLELTPGTCITIPRNMLHRTRPKEARSVNLTIEKADIQTVFEK